ncbi:Flagellar motor switch protein FliG [Methanocaldococcus lauensis]|nr:Flagellar motor switch protein FliG [Methanocaldococcus lauensis]
MIMGSIMTGTTLIIILIVSGLISVALIVKLFLLNKSKGQTLNTYKKLQQEKIEQEQEVIKRLKSMKFEVTDEFIDNIINSENELLEEALNDLDDDPLKKLNFGKKNS